MLRQQVTAAHDRWQLTYRSNLRPWPTPRFVGSRRRRALRPCSRSNPKLTTSPSHGLEEAAAHTSAHLQNARGSPWIAAPLGWCRTLSRSACSKILGTPDNCCNRPAKRAVVRVWFPFCGGQTTITRRLAHAADVENIAMNPVASSKICHRSVRLHVVKLTSKF